MSHQKLPDTIVKLLVFDNLLNKGENLPEKFMFLFLVLYFQQLTLAVGMEWDRIVFGKWGIKNG